MSISVMKAGEDEMRCPHSISEKEEVNPFSPHILSTHAQWAV